MPQRHCFGRVQIRAIFLCVVLAALLTLGALAADKISAGSDAVYFVSNGTGADTNAGTSAAAPLKTLGAAVSKLKSTGGTIVVCAPVNVTNWTPAAINGTTIVTSTYGGVDYAKTAGAYIYMTGTSSTITVSSPFYFENITFDLRTKDTRFAANCHDFGFLSGVNMVKNCDDSAFAYPWIIGGFNASSQMTATTFDNDYTLTIESGHFGVLFLGNRRTAGSQAISDLSGDIGLNISGGTFDSTVYCSGMNVHSGRLAANISGGTFNGIVHGFCRLGTFPAADKMTATAYTAPLYLNITGGNFVKRFRLAESTLETNGAVRPILSDATVRITGGSFGADVCGYGVIGETLLKYDPNVLSADVIKGFPNKTTVTTAATAQRVSATFTNPIRGGGADPYIIEKDGVYYYCISSSTTVDGTAYAAVKVCAHGSIAFGELSTQLRTVVSASNTTIENAQHEFWAPELHYFTAAEVGDAAGWYIYVAADNGDNKNHRMYVWRATEPENPLSEYEFAGQITSSDNHWAIDGTVLHLGGKIYFVWSGWAGDTNVDQRIYIAQMSSPTTISSARTELSVPTYSWERHGNP
ncbi:MAG: family 43 glycosylhydrolase, partial [Clostridia bacterium]|nr:family 43 glycosylhydrolase [Clostridia bacterium]